MRHWIDIDTCITCGRERAFNPIYNKIAIDWLCDDCSRLKRTRKGGTMGDAADDLREHEEMWALLRYDHDHGICGQTEECPFCEERSE